GDAEIGRRRASPQPRRARTPPGGAEALRRLARRPAGRGASGDLSQRGPEGANPEGQEGPRTAMAGPPAQGGPRAPGPIGLPEYAAGRGSDRGDRGLAGLPPVSAGSGGVGGGPAYRLAHRLDQAPQV